MKLSLLSVLLGVVVALPQIIGLMQPSRLAAAAKSFPRNLPIGILLMLLGTAWFVYNVSIEPMADFAAFKNYMMAGFAAVGVLSCVFVQDFLAVRGLAVILLLLGKLMVDTGRVHLGIPLGSGHSNLGLRFCARGHLVYHFSLAPARLAGLGDRHGKPHPAVERGAPGVCDLCPGVGIDRVPRNVT